MNKTVVLGLTGPTGAGKSTVAHFLYQYGCQIIDCDRIAKEVTDTCKPCLMQLQAEFGEDILDSSGRLLRKELAARAFSSKENTLKLNRITHPWILEKISNRISTLEKEHAKMIVLDAPVLFEAGANRLCNFVLSVVAPRKIRLERIMGRDGIGRELALSRISAQYDSSFYIEKSDFVIDGCLPLEQVEQEVEMLVKKISGGGNEEKNA